MSKQYLKQSRSQAKVKQSRGVLEEETGHALCHSSPHKDNLRDVFVEQIALSY